jgi:biotin operon repressor
MVHAVVPMGEKAPTFGWLQFEKKGLKELQKLAMRSPAAMGTLMYLVNHMSRANALVVSQAAIAKELATSRETVNKAIKLLRDHHFVEAIKAGGTTIYVVNSRVAWQGNRGERYAHFGADVIAIESEQNEDLDNRPALKSVPKLRLGERLLVGNEPDTPPDQGELELP